MRRLLDQQQGQPESLQSDAVRLLRSIEPFRSAPGAKQRVRVAMLGRRTAPPVPPVSWIRAAVILPAAFASALGFAGTVGRHWLAVEMGVAEQTAVTRAERPVVAVPAPARVEVPARVEAPPPPVEPAEHPKRLAPAARPVQRAIAPTPAAVAEENARLVVEAMAALRRAHDPARASALLDEYTRRSPEGPLAEEALALSFEAASDASDVPRERAIASRYLALYPHGRFRDAAERALSRSAQ